MPAKGIAHPWRPLGEPYMGMRKPDLKPSEKRSTVYYSNNRECFIVRVRFRDNANHQNYLLEYPLNFDSASEFTDAVKEEFNKFVIAHTNLIKKKAREQFDEWYSYQALLGEDDPDVLAFKKTLDATVKQVPNSEGLLEEWIQARRQKEEEQARASIRKRLEENDTVT